MARRRRRTVFGEPVEVLLGAFAEFTTGPAGLDGYIPFTARMTNAQAGALIRALLRAEAVLLRQQADAVRDGHVHDVLSDPARQGKALVMVVQHARRVVDRDRRSRRADAVPPAPARGS
jgi:hypothetical protein